MSATLTDQIASYRRHAAAQRRMVKPRNIAHLAGREFAWTARSLDAHEAHTDARLAIERQLAEADQRDLARALSAEANALSQLSWSQLSGKDNTGLITYSLTVARRTIRAATVTPVAEKVTEFRRHAAAVRRLTRRASDSPRTREALVAHRDAGAQIAADLDTGLAFALESEHHYLEHAATYRANGGGKWLDDRLAVVRRVIRKAVA